MNKELIQDWFDKEAELYDSASSCVGKLSEAEELRTILKYLPKKAKVLDLGCGTGRHIIPLAKRGHECTGLDISKKMLEQAKLKAKKEKVCVEFLNQSMDDLPFKNNSFDAVLCMYFSLEYVSPFSQRLKVLEEIKRVLKLGGCFIFQVHNVFYPAPKCGWQVLSTFLMKLLRRKKVEFGDAYGLGGETIKTKQFQHYSNFWEVKKMLKLAGLKLERWNFQHKFAGRKIRFPSDFYILNFVARKV